MTRRATDNTKALDAFLVAKFEIDSMHHRLVELSPNPKGHAMIFTPRPHRSFRLSCFKRGEKCGTALGEPCAERLPIGDIDLEWRPPLRALRVGLHEQLRPAVNTSEMMSQLSDCPVWTGGNWGIEPGGREEVQELVTLVLDCVAGLNLVHHSILAPIRFSGIRRRVRHPRTTPDAGPSAWNAA